LSYFAALIYIFKQVNDKPFLEGACIPRLFI